MTRPTSDLARTKLLAFTFLALGWLTSGYLLYRSSKLAGGSIGSDVCSAFFGRGCDETLRAASAVQLGYPLAGWGLVYFALIGLLLAVGSKPVARAALLVTAAGVGGSLVLTTALLSGRSPLCPLCLLIHAANVGLLFAVWGVAMPGGKAVLETRAGKRWLPLALAALVGGAWVEAALYDSEAEGAAVDRAQIIAAYEASEPVDLPLEPEAAATRVRLVVFSSFQCPACQAFAAGVRHLEDHFGDDLAIVYKHFPLESECNAAVSRDIQPRSCEAAWAAEAARIQEAFWPYHDGLFESDLSAGEDLLTAIAIGSGLDLDRWSADRASFGVASRVRADAALGERLGIQGTPTVFLNARRLGNPTLGELETLVGHLLGTGSVH